MTEARDKEAQITELRARVRELEKDYEDATTLASAAIQALPQKDREEIVQVMKDRVATDG